MEDKVVTDSTDTIQMPVYTDSTDFLKKYNQYTRLLFKTSKGIFRGMDFNSTLADAASAEDTLAVEKTNNTITYHFDFNVLEGSDVIYFYNADSVITQIEAVMYPKDLGSQDSLFRDVSAYLNEKYSTPVESTDKKVVWNVLESKLFITLQKAGNSKVHDLKLDFTPMADKPL